MKKILAIDDNNDNLISLKAIIKDVFPESILITANNGDKGLDIAAQEDPDVILLDIVMPEMDGFEVCRRLKKDEKVCEIPVVFLTAHKESKESRIKALEVGADGFLQKPIDEIELVAQIKAMFKIKESIVQKKTETERLTRMVAERTHKLEQSQMATLNLLNDIKSEMNHRLKIEDTLIESEEKFRFLFEKMKHGVFYHRADESLSDINSAGLEMLGITRDQFEERTSYHPEWKIIDENYEEILPVNHPSMLALKSGKRVKSMIVGVYNPKLKSYKWLNVDAEPEFKSGEKKPFRVFVTMTDITKEKIASEELIKSEEKYRKIFQNTDDIIFQINSNGELTDISPSVSKHSGYSREELLGVNAGDLYGQTGEYADLVQKIDSVGVFSDYEVLLKRKDGDLRWFTINAHVTFDENQNPNGYEGSLHDITSRKLAEDALKESESLLRAFINNAPFEIWARDDKELGIVENKAIVDHFGSIIGKRSDESNVNKNIVKLWKSNNKRVFNGETLNEECEYLINGEVRCFQQIMAPIIVNNVVSGVAGFNIDITDRKKAEEAFRKEKILIDAIFDSIPGLIYLYSEDGKLMRWNKKHELQTGYSFEELSKIHLMDWYKDDLESQQAIKLGVANTLKTGFGDAEANLQKKDGTRIPMYFTASKLVIDNKIYFTGIGIDISERKQAELALRDSEGRVNAKLEAILSPDGEIGNLDLADIINTPVIQEIMDEFFKLTKIGVAIVDISGNVVVATGWQDICTKFHRVHPETLKNCIESDTKLTLKVDKNHLKKCKCKNNMWDISTPIFIGNKKLGNLFLGQFFYENEKIDFDFFRVQAQKYGFNENEYIDALKRVPRWNDETVNQVMSFYSSLSSLISSLSFSNLKLARVLEEHRKIEIMLRESNEYFHAIFKNNAAAIAIIESDTTISMVNDAYCNISGFSEEEVIGKSWLSQIPPDDLERLKEYNSNRLQNSLNAPDKYEFTFYRKDGEIRNGIISVAMIDRIKKIIVSFVDITENKKVEEELRKNNSFLDTIIDNIPNMLFIKEAKDLRFIRFNKAGGKIIGSPVSDFIGKNDYDFFTKEQADFFTLKDREVLNGSEIIDIPEEELQSKDNGTRILHTRKVPILNSKGEPEYLLGISEDITEKKQIELHLRESNDRFKAISEFSHNAICILNEQGKIIWANEALVIMGGYSKETLYQSESFVEYIGPDSVEFVVSNFMKFANKLKYEHFYSFSFIHFSGQKRICEKFMTDYEGITGSRFLVISMLDVTEKTITENALIKSERHYKLITEKITDVIWLMDLTGKSFFVSPSIENFTGYSISEYLNQTIEQRFTKESEIYGMSIFMRELKYYQHNLKRLDNYSIKMELEYKCKDGGTKWGELIISPYFSDSDKLIGIHGVTRDITLRKKKEEELEVAKEKAEESDRLKTAFLHNISHEIRTPMNAIVGFSQMLHDALILPEEQKHFTEIIVQSSNQLLSIITDIINIATVEAGQEKIQESKLNVNSIFILINEQYFIKAKNKNIKLIFKTGLAKSDAFIISDETKLIQILSNLINNSMKFTQEGSIEFGYKLKDDFLEFYVKDSGIGIPLEMHDEIFKRFRQVESDLSRQFGGSGLGLSISQAYVELLGGKIWLESENGTTFYFTIPYKKAKTTNMTKKIEETIVSSGFERQITMLIAEDEDVNFMLAEKILSSLKFTIIRAINGAIAVEICKTNPEINLVLMDIKMPIMNGYDATKQIKEFRPNLPIIALTAYSNEADRGKALSCGCADFISKPFKRDDLILKIKELLG